MRRVFSLLMAVLILCSLALPTFANGVVNLEKTAITITPARNNMTSTDLFGNFKGVMPGDTLTQEIEIRNLAVNFDYVKVYMQAIPHSDDPAKKNEPEIGISVDENFDFLSKLTLTVKKGDEVIYSASPEGEYQLDEAGDLEKSVYLGKITRKNAVKPMVLTVELNVPIELDNEYAARMGEVDWLFTFEGRNNPSDSPKTGDYVIIGAVALMAVSGAALLILLIGKRRKQHN